MRLKLIFLLAFFALSKDITSQISAEKRLFDCVNTIINDKNLKGAFFGVKLVDCGTGKIIFEHNPELKMIPASIQKVITTGTGFSRLGDAYTFKTSVYRDGTIVADSVLNGNLYIAGGGDPSLGSENFPESASETVFNKITCGLKNAGIAKINGRIIVDDSYFDGNRSTSETVHPSWEWEDIGSCYGTGVHGLNFCENFFTATISCNKPAGIAIIPEYPYSEIVMPAVEADITIIHRDSLPNVAPFSSPETNRYIIRGEMPSGKDVELDCALQNPSIAFEFWLRNYLSHNGIAAIYNTVDSAFGSEKHLLMEIESPPYRELAKFTNYVSNNLFADAIFKNISKQATGEASFSKSAKNMNDFLNKTLNLNTQNIRIVDGSGLSRHNLTTAEFMCEYLRAIKLHVPDFHLSLPSPGSDKSTLKYFMTSYSNKNSKERIFLKSGSMTGVLNYAGYIINKKGETICVVIMTNNFLCKTKELRPKLERLVYLMSEL
ncbi:MAG: D-alanyl-D-alanine carboxypeptidase/D-alanyl-D-alanine-endopeptidase [Prevotellaceae bacterium]|jgi:D-alanyl-D-alanine carboxypeptidase/D-alanyl-D-alanine-endopeptidase (penicillin-binding protein 4)|nr:D-alanyl-D-alanine carboxypeptidase/D-alanyl-D-alanine-endopeptidase [Prevotellaceae bacterium]